MEAEAEKLKSIKAKNEKNTIEVSSSSTTTASVANNSGIVTYPSNEEKKEVDARSVYVGNVSLF